MVVLGTTVHEFVSADLFRLTASCQVRGWRARNSARQSSTEWL